MKNAIFDLMNRIVQLDRVKDSVSRFWYRYVNTVAKDAADVCFLNYGYAPLNGERIRLDAEDEENRIYIQLYHRVASAIDLFGLDVVEISCGRGGGARYMKHYLQPRTLCAMDRAVNAITYCRKRHVEEGLHFTSGDAQVMPFADSSFDVVVNVEASHDYPRITRFFAEVHRVLRPGGHFLYADFRATEDCPAWRDQILRSGLQIVEEEDITPNVVKGLEINTDRTNMLIQRLVPRIMRPLFRQFAGARGSLIYERFDSGRSRYHRYLLRKETALT